MSSGTDSLPPPADDSPACRCREIQRINPRRHFKGCPQREDLPEQDQASIDAKHADAALDAGRTFGMIDGLEATLAELQERFAVAEIAIRARDAAIARAVTAERWIEEHECEDVAGGALDAQEDAERRFFEARDQLKALEQKHHDTMAALERYGQHREDCDWLLAYHEHSARMCTCGLRKALGLPPFQPGPRDHG